MRILRLCVFFILALTLLLVPLEGIPRAAGDLSADLDAAQKKMDQLKAQLAQIQKLIKENKSAKYNLLGQLTALNGQMDELTDELDQINGHISQLESLLKQTAAQVSAKEKQYAQLTSETETSVELLYRVSNLDIAGLAFSGGNLNGTVEAQEGVSAILRQITASLASVTTQKLALEADRSSYAQTKQELEQVYTLKKQQSDLLADQKTAKEQTVRYLSAKGNQYSSDERRIQAEMDKEEKLIDEIIRKINEAKYGGSSPEGKLQWPLPGHIVITDVFGYRTHPITHQWRLHRGIDLGCPMGTKVLAPADGEVVYVGQLTDYGNMMMLQCGQHMTLVFAHLKSFVAKKGQDVKRGDVIALTDNTGWSTGPHLHFEVRIDGTAKDPMLYLGPKP